VPQPELMARNAGIAKLIFSADPGQGMRCPVENGTASAGFNLQDGIGMPLGGSGHHYHPPGMCRIKIFA